MKTSFNLLKIVFLALIFTSVPSHVLCSDLVQVEYNPVTANLTVKAENANLEGVLSLVSHKTGVWVRIDPSIEKRITIDLNDIPLESVLRKLSRGLSHSMFYESLDNGGHRLVGIEIVSNESVPGSHSDTRLLTNATRGSSFFTNHSLRDNNSSQPDPEIRDQSTVDNAGIGSPLDTAPEQSSDMATAESTPVAGEAVLDVNAGDVIPIDSNNEKSENTPDEKIVSPKGGATTLLYEKSY